MESTIRVKNNFSSTNCWGVLEGQQLTYYDSYDHRNPSAASVKGVFFTKNAKVSKVTDTFKGIRYGISIVNDKTKLTFDCTDAAVCGVWFSSILRSTTMHLDGEEQKKQLEKHKKVLGLDETESYNKADIAKAYKKLCLKEHPDKGGNIEVFNQIKEAYNALMSLQTVLDELSTSQSIHYEAMIEKIAGSGIGLVVAEDKLRKRVLITRCDDRIKIVGLTEEADGEIKPGDALIGIDEDDCSDWHLSRVRARLNESRVPLGTVVHFTFERLIPVTPENSPKDDDISVSPRKERNGSSRGSPVRENSTSSSPRKEPTSNQSSSKETVFKVFPSVDEAENNASKPSPVARETTSSSNNDSVEDTTISLRKHKAITDQLKSSNQQLQREIEALKEANEKIRQELTDQHDRKIYELNDKLVGAYREIKSMATEIATLRYQLNSR